MTEDIYYTDTQQLLWYCACHSLAWPSCPMQLGVTEVNIAWCSKFRWWQDEFVDEWLIVDPILHLSLCPLKLSQTRFVTRGLLLNPHLSSSSCAVSSRPADDSGPYHGPSSDRIRTGLALQSELSNETMFTMRVRACACVYGAINRSAICVSAARQLIHLWGWSTTNGLNHVSIFTCKTLKWDQVASSRIREFSNKA